MEVKRGTAIARISIHGSQRSSPPGAGLALPAGELLVVRLLSQYYLHICWKRCLSTQLWNMIVLGGSMGSRHLVLVPGARNCQFYCANRQHQVQMVQCLLLG
jgi:hypothetical protein